jgi:GntR family transcriptional repressor for pyruvate dehydrogenase complex
LKYAVGWHNKHLFKEEQELTIESKTRVSQAVKELSRLSMAHSEGDFLGAEDDLLRQLGVSRPTLRQAAKIAENDKLIAVRRGARGGIYASRPKAEDAVRVLARFLRMRGATLGHIVAVSGIVSEEAAMLAASCTDEALRGRLEAFVKRIDQSDSRLEIIKAETELARLVAEMSGNPAIELFMAISYSFGMEEEGSLLYGEPDQRHATRKLQRDLCAALLDGDPELAALMMRRRHRALAEWIGHGSVRLLGEGRRSQTA